MPKRSVLGRILYGVGVALAVSLFVGNALVVELDAAMSPALYFVLSFGYILGFVLALLGALIGHSREQDLSHWWKLGLGVLVALVAVRQIYMVFQLADGTVLSQPRFFGGMALGIVVMVLVIMAALARKLPGKTGLARWGVELQMASFVFFALAATLTCSLGALCADSDGLNMTAKVIAMKNAPIADPAGLVTPRSYGAMTGYQVISSWVLGLAVFLTGTLFESGLSKQR